MFKDILECVREELHVLLNFFVYINNISVARREYDIWELGYSFRQINMRAIVEWCFDLLERHHSKSRIFKRTNNFQINCCRPWNKKLRIVNAVVTFRSDRLTEMNFSWNYSFLDDDDNRELTKLIHNRSKCKLIVKTTAVCMYANEQMRLCFNVLGRYSLDIHF